MEFTKRRAKDADAYEICASPHHQTKDISDTAPDNDTLSSVKPPVLLVLSVVYKGESISISLQAVPASSQYVQFMDQEGVHLSAIASGPLCACGAKSDLSLFVFSIITPTFNGGSRIVACLEALLE